MVTRAECKKALITSAFFIVSTLSFSAYAEPLSCPQFIPQQQARIRYVHDGDTVILDDNRHIRLIGIDTPELARDDRPADAFAIEARDYVRQLIADTGHDVKLMYGAENKDHYGRTLAHIQLADGSLLESRLLSAGLAVAYTTPPNSRLTNCYQQFEQRARSAQLKLWHHPKYQSTSTDSLTNTLNGFRIVYGKVTRIGESKNAIWINLEHQFAVRIPKKDLAYFENINFNAWIGRSIEVRGWLKHYHDQFHITARHPATIHLLQ